MLGWTFRAFSKGRDLRMVWEVARAGRRSLLAGTAHFFPYHFRRSLRRIIGGARTVLLEGPLDPQAARKVVDSGHGRGGGALYNALDAAARRRILDRLGVASVPLDAPQLIRTLVFGREEDWLEAELRALKPWLAFFGIWTRFRAREGWSYTLDLDAARIAGELGRPVRYLETIDEQVAALDSVPLDRFVKFLALEDWSAYCEDYVRRYLAGDLDGLVAGAGAFPTYCEPIVEHRDPVLAERMLPSLEEGDVAAFVGISHCPGVLAILRQNDFTVTPIAA